MGLADELFLRITEHLLGAGIYQQDGPGVVYDDNSFGERLQKGAYRDVSLKETGGKSYLPLDSQFIFLTCVFLIEVGYGHRFSNILLVLVKLHYPWKKMRNGKCCNRVQELTS